MVTNLTMIMELSPGEALLTRGPQLVVFIVNFAYVSPLQTLLFLLHRSIVLTARWHATYPA